MDELQAFRWIGDGILNVTLPDGRVSVKITGSIVEDVQELAALGAERITDFMRDGLATHELEVVQDGISFREEIPSELEASRAEAQLILQDVHDSHSTFTAALKRALDAGAVAVRVVSGKAD